MELNPGLARAQRIVIESLTPLSAEPCPLLDSVGRVLADDVRTRWAVPISANAAMDGYAICAADAVEGTRLMVSGVLMAGAARPDLVVRPGRTVRVMTGALVPPGADCVVADEAVSSDGHTIELLRAPAKGQNIRQPGEDVGAGQIAVPAGRRIDSAVVAMLAQCACMLPQVVRAARVGLISCGDELRVAPHCPAGAEVVDTNLPALQAALRSLGAHVTPTAAVPDDEVLLDEAVRKGLDGTDILVLVAGASRGVRDLAARVLERAGARWLFRGVDVRPGRPAALGMLTDGRPVFSLPGNPVSALLMFDALVYPAILRLQGDQDPLPVYTSAILDEPVVHRRPGLQLMRVKLWQADGQWRARPAGQQASGLLSTSVAMDGVALVETAPGGLPAGTEVRVYRPQ